MTRNVESHWSAQRARVGRITSLALAAMLAAMAGPASADVPGRAPPRGTVPNPGTQQQELSNITFPAPFNVFEFTVTCAGCHGGTIDQQAAHFGVQAGTNMASSARDPIFRANQIAVNNILKSVTSVDGAGNMCMRCHSPNGWYSGRFDPTLGGDAQGKTMMHSIVASTDDEGISCESCHRAVGNVKFKSIGGLPNTTDPAWNLLAGISDWPHGGAPITNINPGDPYGDTSLQYADGMTYGGPYPGTVKPSFTDDYLLFNAFPTIFGPSTGTYTGQIFAVYPQGWKVAGPNGTVIDVSGQPVKNVDGSLAPMFEEPVNAPYVLDPNGRPVLDANGFPIVDYQAQSISIEHPTFENKFLKTSEMCASCHELTVPVASHGMPEQRTFTEWKYSAFSKAGAFTNAALPGKPVLPAGATKTFNSLAGEIRCQDCHMPKVKHEYDDVSPVSLNADPVMVGWFPYGKDRNNTGGTSSHKHAGANRDLPDYMKLLYPEPDLEVIGAQTGNDTRIFPGMLSTRDPLLTRAQRITELSLRDGVNLEDLSVVEVSAGVYEAKVRVVNRTGHKIPSGYPDGRRFWISLDVKNASGSVYTSGFYDDATAELKTSATTPFSRARTNLIASGAVPVGNAVQARGYATDSATEVLVVSPVALPDGTLTSFQTFVQDTAAQGGKVFQAFVLRPTASAGSYTVVHASGNLVVPAAPGVATFPANVAVKAGDRIAHQGNGVPLDFTAAGVDPMYYPTASTPVSGSTIALGTAPYPMFDPAAYGQQPRTYSFGATVNGTNAVMVYERVTCWDGLVGLGVADGKCDPDELGKVMGPNLLNNAIAFDNRIPPAGFEKAKYRTGGASFWNYDPADLRYFEDVDRYPDGQGYDVVTYRFAAAPGQVLSARATAYWQTHTKEFLEHLRDQDTSDVRPQGPINPFMVGYPLTPSYLSDVVVNQLTGQPWFAGPTATTWAAFTASRPEIGMALKDNWGGVAYAAWALTGKGAPYVVAAADTSVTAVPGQVTGVTAATPTAPDQVNLTTSAFETVISWVAPATGPVEGYEVWIRYGLDSQNQPGGPDVAGSTASWDRLAVVPASQVSLTNKGVNVGKTYAYAVRAFNAKGLGPFSTAVAFKQPWDFPLPPDFLQLVGAPTSTTVTLSWLDTADNEAAFLVEAAVITGNQVGPFTFTQQFATQTGCDPATQGCGGPGQLMAFGGNLQTVTGLQPNTCYLFQVQAVNGTGLSGPNTNAPINQICTAAPPVAPPTAPVLSFSAVASTTATLSWTGGTGATSWSVTQVSRATPAATVTINATNNGAALTGLLPGVAYTFAVNAINSGGTTSSNAVSFTTVAAPLPAPTGLGRTALRTNGFPSINVTWTTPAGSTAAQVEIQRRQGVGAWGPSQFVTSTVGAQSFLDTTVQPGASYSYQIRAVSPGQTSIWVVGTAVTTQGLPNAPNNTSANGTRAGATDNVRVQWTTRDGSGVAANSVTLQYRVRTGTGNAAWGPYVTLTGLPGNVNFNVIPNLPRNRGFQAQVRVVSPTGLQTGWSNTASTTTP